jgi:hypothetical protein
MPLHLIFPFPEHLRSLPVFSRVRVPRSLVLCVCCVDRCLSLFFWPLCCLSFFDLRILITPSVSFGLCVVCPSLIYGFWLPLQYLLALVLSVLWFTDSDYLFSIFKLYFQNTTKRNELFSLKRTTFVLRSDWRISGLTPKWVSRGGDYHASLTSL